MCDGLEILSKFESLTFSKNAVWHLRLSEGQHHFERSENIICDLSQLHLPKVTSATSFICVRKRTMMLIAPQSNDVAPAVQMMLCPADTNEKIRKHLLSDFLAYPTKKDAMRKRLKNQYL